MTENVKSAPEAEQTNREKDPDEWVTGDETMTGAQASYLKTLCEEAGEAFDDTLTKAEASKRIEELQAKTGRGIDHANPETVLPGSRGKSRRFVSGCESLTAAWNGATSGPRFSKWSAPIAASSLKQLRS